MIVKLGPDRNALTFFSPFFLVFIYFVHVPVTYISLKMCLLIETRWYKGGHF